MTSDYRGSYGHPSTHDRYIGHEFGMMQHQFVEGDQHRLDSHPQPHVNTHPHPLALAQSHDLHGAICREIEKERIRQEIIMSEILRRRALEAEVRRELVVERELALHGGSNGFHFGSTSPMGLDMPIRLPFVEAEGRFLEERMMLSLMQMNNLSNRREIRLSESLQFQSASDDNVSPLVKPVLEGVREKKKINLQAKAVENITGAAKDVENITGGKRALSGSDISESEYSNLKKKAKEEWSCDLCQVSASSERGLNEHLQGQKHKTKEAALRAQKACKTYSIGLCNKEVAKSITGSGTADPGTNIEEKFTSEPSPFSKSGDANSGTDDQPLQENINSDSLTKNESLVPHKVKKNDIFWCEICQVGVFSQNVMDTHKMGKKHRRKAVKIISGGVFPSREDEVGEKVMAEDAGAVKETSEQDAGAVKETLEQDAVVVDEPVIPKMQLGC